LKSVLAAADATPTLVFDEVDVGIGGRSGQVVGETLAALARTHQVLCITHLAQVAAFADGHFRIIKRDVRGRTISDVERLDEPERIEELAAMLDGIPITPVARASARDLAERAAARKASTETTRQPAAD
ncbi:MAG: DNA repair protein RecN, partial [Thermomicrobiales bacterium]